MQANYFKSLLSKIILFYSIFYVVMKLIAVIFKNAWPIPNLIFALPYVIFALVGWRMLKTEQYSWIYVIAGVIVISIIRYYEMEWMVAIQQYLN
ncbi:hypothetical protein BH23BAC2_BH23BAC2_02110 [soil metagenome]